MRSSFGFSSVAPWPWLWLLAILVAAPPMTAHATCFHPEGNLDFVVVGDVTGNGTTNVADQLCQIFVSLWLLDTQGAPAPSCLVRPLPLADINCDGTVSVSDVLLGVNVSIGFGLPEAVDGDLDGCHDACGGCVGPTESSCLIVGACIPEGSGNPTDPCEGCHPNVDASSYTPRQNGDSCGSGLICNNGACEPGSDASPYNVVAVAGDGQAGLSWTAPNILETVTSYVVQVYDQNGGVPAGVTGATSRNIGSAATSFVFVGLTNGLSYRFRVLALTTGDPTPQSPLSNLVTPVGVPSAPIGVVAAPGNTSAMVSFSPPASNGGAPISGYRVTTQPDGFTVNVGSSPALVSGLVNGLAYWFTVAATNVAGTGPESLPSNLIIPVGLPGAPTLVAAHGQDSQVQIDYLAPIDFGGAESVTYLGYCEKADQTGAQTAPSVTLSAIVSGLQNSQGYRCRVAAVNTSGQGAWSGWSDIVVPGAIVQPPGGVVAPPVTLYSSAMYDGAYAVERAGALTSPVVAFGAATFSNPFGAQRYTAIVAPVSTAYGTSFYDGGDSGNGGFSERTGALVSPVTAFGAHTFDTGLGHIRVGSVVAPVTSAYGTAIYDGGEDGNGGLSEFTGALVSPVVAFGAETFDTGLGSSRVGSVVAPTATAYGTAIYDGGEDGNGNLAETTGALVSPVVAFGAETFDTGLGSVRIGSVVAPTATAYGTSIYDGGEDGNGSLAETTGALVSPVVTFGAETFATGLGAARIGSVVAATATAYGTSLYDGGEDGNGSMPETTGAVVSPVATFGATGFATGLGVVSTGAVVARPSQTVGHPYITVVSPLNVSIAAASFTLALDGLAFDRIDAIEFYNPSGVLDSNLVAGTPAVDLDGLGLVVGVTIAPSTATGTWTVVVRTPSGYASAVAPAGTNVDFENELIVTN